MLLERGQLTLTNPRSGFRVVHQIREILSVSVKRRWNLLAPAGFLVVLAAFLSYFAFFARFPATRDFPWLNLLLMAAGWWLVVAGLRRAFGQPDRYGGKISGPVLAVLSLLVSGLFLFYNFYFSKQLPAAAGAPRVGQKAPDFTLPDMNGRPVALSSLLAEEPGTEAGRNAGPTRKPWVLLIFYRGYW